MTKKYRQLAVSGPLFIFKLSKTRLIIRIPTLSLTAEQRAHLKPGEKLKVKFEGKAMHFFDTEEEKNILYPYVPEVVE